MSIDITGNNSNLTFSFVPEHVDFPNKKLDF